MPLQVSPQAFSWKQAWQMLNPHLQDQQNPCSCLQQWHLDRRFFFEYLNRAAAW
jgi:hypothetical protein